MLLSELLEKERKRNGYTILEMSKAIGTSLHCYSSWTSGTRIPSSKQFEKVWKFLAKNSESYTSLTFDYIYECLLESVEKVKK